MRTLPMLGEELVRQLEAAWRERQPDWARKRLLLLRLIGQHEHTSGEIMKIVGVCRDTFFRWRDMAMKGGWRGCSSAGEDPVGRRG